MSNIRNVLIRRELELKDQEFQGSDDILGKTSLTCPSYISSTRSIMFTTHLNQLVVLNNPEPPKVFTGHENKAGKHSTGYMKADRDFEVIRKIPKFSDNPEIVYTLIIRYLDDGEYDVIVKKPFEDLTEIYGFEYNTDFMDGLKEGDHVPKGSVLYKTNSYDEHMNYGYGINVPVAYALIPQTTEDAIVVSKTFKKRMECSEIMTYRISLNDNDILLDWYGKDKQYKCFPDIGDHIRDNIICGRRRIFNSQKLYDMKISNLKKINFESDTVLYGEGHIIDINIYCNKEIDEVPNTMMNHQIIHYLSDQQRYYESIVESCRDIIVDKEPHTKDLSFLYKKAKDFIDPEVKWKNEGTVAFSNMILEFTCIRKSELSIGQKSSGRQGNKGVVSEIWDDEDMYYTEDGRRAQIIMTPTSQINRLITMPLFETTINHIIDLMKLKMKELTTDKEKEELFFDIVGTLNETEAKKIKDFYKKFKLKGRQKFIDYILSGDIYIELPPIWEEGEPIYEKIKKLYDKYDWINKEQVYINRFGRKIPVIKPMIIADLYMIRMEQSSKKNFSARSTGSVDKKNVPVKNDNAKNGYDLYSNTPIRVGVMETINSIIATSPEIVSKLHTYYRSSVKGREKIFTDILSGKRVTFNKSKKMNNRNVSILKAYLKSMGLKIVDLDDKYKIDVETGKIRTFTKDSGKMFIGTRTQFDDSELREKAIQNVNDNYVIVGSKEDYDNMVEDVYQKMKRPKDKYYIDIPTKKRYE